MVQTFALALLVATADLASPAEPPAAGPREGWRQGMGLGWHGTTFWSNESSHFTFHSLDLSYLVSWGDSGIFIRGSALLPLQGQQDGRVYPASDYYGLRFGGDLLAGWQWRWTAPWNLEVEGGPGLHTTFLWLRGAPGYTSFSAFPIGLGGAGQVRWNSGARVGSWPFSVGAFGSAAYDLFDPAHANDLRRGLTFTAGVLAGLQAR
jgi:hypothetical protein